MRLINTNLLNYFYKKGVKPLIENIAKKLDPSKLANNLLTTVAGFAMDARQGPVIQGQIDDVRADVTAINGKLNTITIIPDLANSSVVINVNGNYTVPEDGYIQAYCNSSPGRIDIGGVAVFYMGSQIEIMSGFIPVKKGQVVVASIFTNQSNVKFIPLKS